MSNYGKQNDLLKLLLILWQKLVKTSVNQTSTTKYDAVGNAIAIHR